MPKNHAFVPKGSDLQKRLHGQFDIPSFPMAVLVDPVLVDPVLVGPVLVGPDGQVLNIQRGAGSGEEVAQSVRKALRRTESKKGSGGLFLLASVVFVVRFCRPRPRSMTIHDGLFSGPFGNLGGNPGRPPPPLHLTGHAPSVASRCRKSSRHSAPAPRTGDDIVKQPLQVPADRHESGDREGKWVVFSKEVRYRFRLNQRCSRLF